MPNNNPGGVNAFGGWGKEAPYGAIEKEKTLTRAAPLPSVPAVGAPKQAQQRAVGKKGAAQSSAPATAPATSPSPAFTPQMVVSQFWQEMAAEPGASPLVQLMAQGL